MNVCSVCSTHKQFQLLLINDLKHKNCFPLPYKNLDKHTSNNTTTNDMILYWLFPIAIIGWHFLPIEISVFTCSSKLRQMSLVYIFRRVLTFIISVQILQNILLPNNALSFDFIYIFQCYFGLSADIFFIIDFFQHCNVSERMNVFSFW